MLVTQQQHYNFCGSYCGRVKIKALMLSSMRTDGNVTKLLFSVCMWAFICYPRGRGGKIVSFHMASESQQQVAQPTERWTVNRSRQWAQPQRRHVSPVQFVFVVQSTLNSGVSEDRSDLVGGRSCSRSARYDGDDASRVLNVKSAVIYGHVQDALPDRQPMKRLQQQSGVSDPASLTHDPCQIVLRSL